MARKYAHRRFSDGEKSINSSVSDLARLMIVLERHFEPLKQKYQWGTNAYYYLAGLTSVHPSYIQLMLQDARFRSNDILNTINELSKTDGCRFDSKKITAPNQSFIGASKGTWSPEKVIGGKDLLLLGPGTNL